MFGVVPKLGFGTYLIGKQEMSRVIDAALRIGYRSFDTAVFYENEKFLGDALAEHLPKHNLSLSSIYLTSKYFPQSLNSPKDETEKQIENSLKSLRRDHLDLVLIHYPRPFYNDDKDVTNPKTRQILWEKLEKCQKMGMIREIGVSNYEIQHIREIQNYSNLKPSVNQVEYHPHFQRTELKEYCRAEGIQLQAFSPLGRQHPDLLGCPHISKIAKKYQKSTAWIILRWIVQSQVALVPKSITPSRIQDNFEATIGTEIRLTDEEMSVLNSLNIDRPYVEDNGWLCV